jgi:hypothetical protein
MVEVATGLLDAFDQPRHGGDGRKAFLNEVVQLQPVALGLPLVEHGGELSNGAEQTRGGQPLIRRTAGVGVL